MWRGDPGHWCGRGHRQAHKVSRALCHHSLSLSLFRGFELHPLLPTALPQFRHRKCFKRCITVKVSVPNPSLYHSFFLSHVMYVCVCVCVCLCICFWNIHSSFPYRLERLELILFAIPASLESSLSQLPHLRTLVVWPDTSHDIMVSCLCILWPCFCDCDVVKVSVSVLWPGFCVSVL